MKNIREGLVPEIAFGRTVIRLDLLNLGFRPRFLQFDLPAGFIRQFLFLWALNFVTD
jgi:hypothetical protein